MEHIQMNKFEIVDMPGMNTVAFLITREDSLNEDIGVSLQKLDHLDREEEGKIRKEFNVIADDEFQKIVLLTLTHTKAIISTGELSKSGFVAKDNGVTLSYGSIFSAEGVEYKEFVYTSNMTRRFSIIDTTTGEEVKPVLFMDETTKEIKGKCKLLPLRAYVVLEVKIMEE